MTSFKKAIQPFQNNEPLHCPKEPLTKKPVCSTSAFVVAGRFDTAISFA